ncbi:MAG: beta-hydroxyacyl-ACP dehydratase [Clostridiales bacterium]|nr:beta-hydroxyacyl-ACP dehydratase [Clostridiales bacterium]
MTHKELETRLPHRDAMLLLGEADVEERDGVKVAVGLTKIRGDEWFLQGHFPGNPVVPGVIQCEILAQSCCMLIECDSGTPYFTGMKNVKWRHPVRPGDEFATECSIVRKVGSFYQAKGIGRVNGEVCVEAEFTFALVKAEE